MAVLGRVGWRQLWVQNQMLGPWGPYLFRGEPEQQEAKVFSREEARMQGKRRGWGHLKSPSSLFPGTSLKGSSFGGVDL